MSNVRRNVSLLSQTHTAREMRLPASMPGLKVVSVAMLGAVAFGTCWPANKCFAARLHECTYSAALNRVVPLQMGQRFACCGSCLSCTTAGCAVLRPGLHGLGAAVPHYLGKNW